jgi:hypothetical protein
VVHGVFRSLSLSHMEPCRKVPLPSVDLRIPSLDIGLLVESHAPATGPDLRPSFLFLVRTRALTAPMLPHFNPRLPQAFPALRISPFLNLQRVLERGFRTLTVAVLQRPCNAMPTIHAPGASAPADKQTIVQFREHKGKAGRQNPDCRSPEFGRDQGAPRAR